MPDITQLPDQEIVRKSLQDANSFVFLMQRYEKKLLRYIRRISSLDLQTAEDILQEVFIKVYQNLNAYNDSFSFSSWIYRITYNQTISTVRKIKARPQVLINNETEDGTLIIDLVASDIDIVEDFQREELTQKDAESSQFTFREV